MKLAIFDWKGTLFAAETGKLIEGAEALLRYLHDQGVKLVLIGKDQGGDMNAKVDQYNLRNLFEEVEFIATEKTAEIFNKYAKKFDPNQVWVIGDRIKGEINVGNAIGANTVWVKQGKFAHEVPEISEEEPNIIVTSLDHLNRIFEEHFAGEQAV